MYELNPQSIFNYALDFITKQGKPSIERKPDGEIVCQYLSDSGLRCAASCLFTDEERNLIVTKKLNVESAHGLYFNNAFPERLLPFIGLIRSIQRAHDGASRTDNFIKHFRLNMSDVASANGLTYES